MLNVTNSDAHKTNWFCPYLEGVEGILLLSVPNVHETESFRAEEIVQNEFKKQQAYK